MSMPSTERESSSIDLTLVVTQASLTGSCDAVALTV
jgi:hypothetical protein